MNKKFAIAAAIVVLGIGGMIFAAMPDNKPAEPRPAATSATPPGTGLSASQPSFDFGTISMSAGTVTHQYRIVNGGSEPIVVGKLYTSCMCTEAKLIVGIRQYGPYGMPGHSPIPAINQTIAPGERAIIETVFDPAAHGPAGVGPIERVVTLENSAGRPLELFFAANVTP